MSVSGLTLGIISLALTVALTLGFALVVVGPIFFLIGAIVVIVCSGVGLLLSVVGLFRHKRRGMGLRMPISALVANVIALGAGRGRRRCAPRRERTHIRESRPGTHRGGPDSPYHWRRASRSAGSAVRVRSADSAASRSQPARLRQPLHVSGLLLWIVPTGQLAWLRPHNPQRNTATRRGTASGTPPTCAAALPTANPTTWPISPDSWKRQPNAST